MTRFKDWFLTHKSAIYFVLVWTAFSAIAVWAIAEAMAGKS